VNVVGFSYLFALRQQHGVRLVGRLEALPQVPRLLLAARQLQ